MRVAILVLAATFTATAAAVAQPDVDDVQGTLTHGATAVVTGVRFGTKNPPEPIIWDNMEGGANHTGQDVSAVDPRWQHYITGPTYSRTWSHSGDVSASNEFEEAFSMLYVAGVTPTTEIYMTNWTYTANIGGGDDYAVVKWNRINSSEAAGGGGRYNGAGCNNFGHSFLQNTTDGSRATHMGITTNPTAAEYVADLGGYEFWWNREIRVEAYCKLSTPGVADGINHGVAVGIDEDYIVNRNRGAGETFLLDTGLFSVSAANETGDFLMFMDDLYMDITRARIEIGNAPTFAACTHREIQIPSGWQPDRLTFTVNEGTLNENSGQLYLFVVDENGDASAGHPITMEFSGTGGTGDDGPPGPPGQPVLES
jgi:hypothetical protein